MSGSIFKSALLAMFCLPPSLCAANDTLVQFVACPIYRDTDAGKKSGCWLADDRASGRRYDVSQSPTKPDWNHEVLVEGKVTRQKDVCGGVVLAPVRVSVLQGACVPKMLPAEGYPGRAFVLPPRNVRPISEVRAQPDKPYAEKTFYLFFDFDRDFMVYQLDDYFFDRAVAYIRAVEPREVVVTAYAATESMSVSSRRMREDIAIAKRRAAMVTESLKRLGVPENVIRTRWRGNASPIDVDDADGLPDSSRRRVEIAVRPDLP